MFSTIGNICQSYKRSKEFAAFDQFASRAIFTGGLSAVTTLEDLKAYFSNFGDIGHIEYTQSQFDPGVMNNYAEIWFQNNEDKIKNPNHVIREQKIHIICGKSVDCTNLFFDMRKIKNNDINLGGDTILHQDGIPELMDNVGLANAFMSIGELRQCYIIRTDIPQQQAVVQFYSHKLATFVAAQKSIIIDGFVIQIQSIEELYYKASLGYKFKNMMTVKQTLYNFPRLSEYQHVPEISVQRMFIANPMDNNAEMYCDFVFQNPSGNFLLAPYKTSNHNQKNVRFRKQMKLKRQQKREYTLQQKALQMEAQEYVCADPLQNNKPEVEDNFSENDFPDLMGNIPQSNTLKKADEKLLSKEAVYQLLSKKVDNKLSNKSDDQSSEKDDSLTENDEDQLSEKAPSLVTDDRLSYSIPELVNSKISFASYSFKNGVEIKKNNPPTLVACEKPSDKVPKHDLPVKVACEKPSGKQETVTHIGQKNVTNNSSKNVGDFLKSQGKNVANNSSRNVGDFLKSSGKKEAGSLTAKNNEESKSNKNFEDFLKFTMVEKKSPNKLQK